jgi:hypothetical protein
MKKKEPQILYLCRCCALWNSTTQFLVFFKGCYTGVETRNSVPTIVKDRKRTKVWLLDCRSIVVMLGAGTYVYFDKEVVSQDLGTYDNPEVAMKETQKH